MKLIIETGNNRNLTGTSWSRLKAIVKKRDKAICQYCGTKDENGQVDHIIPLSRGGTDKLDNLAWSCSVCNHRKNVYLPLISPRPRPIFRLLFAGFAELILAKLIGRYTDIPDMESAPAIDANEEEWEKWEMKRNEWGNSLETMRNQKVRNWLRETVWPGEYRWPTIIFEDSGLGGE